MDYLLDSFIPADIVGYNDTGSRYPQQANPIVRGLLKKPPDKGGGDKGGRSDVPDEGFLTAP